MKKRNTNTLMLLSGMIAGAATVYFIKSPKGQQMLDLVFEKSEQLKSTMLEKSKDAKDNGIEIVDQVIKKATIAGESVVNNTSEQITSLPAEAKAKVDEQLSNFQRGVAKAEKQLKRT